MQKENKNIKNIFFLKNKKTTTTTTKKHQKN